MFWRNSAALLSRSNVLCANTDVIFYKKNFSEMQAWKTLTFHKVYVRAICKMFLVFLNQSQIYVFVFVPI